MEIREWKEGKEKEGEGIGRRQGNVRERKQKKGNEADYKGEGGWREARKRNQTTSIERKRKGKIEMRRDREKAMER